MSEFKNNSSGFFTDDKFHRLLEAGKVGEAIIMPMLSYACKCWRYPMEHEANWICPCAPTIIDKTDDTEFQKVLDIDAQVHFTCDGCPVFKEKSEEFLDLDGEEADQWHEIKTNYATHGESREEGGVNYTQNILIETVENNRKLGKFKYDAIEAEHEKPKGKKSKEFSELISECVRTDPRYKYYSTVFNTPGAGWYYKALKHYVGIPRGEKRGEKESIKGEPLLADWYHFYQRIQAADGYKVSEATQEEIDKWLNDDRVPRGSLLITQYPFSYCVSISGSYLRKLVKERKEIEYGTGIRKKGILVPIADLIPCDVYRGDDLTHDDELSAKTGALWNGEKMRIFISGECAEVKRTPASGNMEGQRLYTIDRLAKEIERGVYSVTIPMRRYTMREREIVEAKTIQAEAVFIKVEQQKEMFKRKEAKKKGWDKYSDTYLIPKMEMRALAVAEKY